MRRSRPSAPTMRGFTLVEVVIAATLIATLSAVGMAVFLHAQKTTMEARVRGQMERDAQLIHDSLQRDLAYFGTGVPAGCNGQRPATTPLSGRFLRPIMRIGHDRAMAFLGDMPFPNSEFTGVATPVELDDDFVATNHRIAVTSEISGPCVPPLTSAPARHRCRTTETTLIPGTYVATDECTSAQNDARTCPWGMKKWPAPAGGGELFWTFVDPGGNWYERSNRESPLAQVSVDANWVGIHLDHTPDSLDRDFQGNDLFDNVGGAYISMIDRVFWVVEDTPGTACTPTAAGLPGDCEVKRNQCWGQMPANSDLSAPTVGAGAFPSSSGNPTNCTPGAINGGTGWETIATNVKDVRFRYFGTNPTTPLTTALDLTAGQELAGVCANATTGAVSPVGTKSQVRSVEVTVDLERVIPGAAGRSVKYSQSRRFLLPSRETTE